MSFSWIGLALLDRGRGLALGLHHQNIGHCRVLLCSGPQSSSRSSRSGLKSRGDPPVFQPPQGLRRSRGRGSCPPRADRCPVTGRPAICQRSGSFSRRRQRGSSDEAHPSAPRRAAPGRATPAARSDRARCAARAGRRPGVGGIRAARSAEAFAVIGWTGASAPSWRRDRPRQHGKPQQRIGRQARQHAPLLRMRKKMRQDALLSP